jgi:hypothetical protein
MKTFVIAGCRCGSHTLQKTLENNGFNSRMAQNPTDYKKRYSDDSFFNFIDEGDEEIILIDVYRPPIERCLSHFFDKLSSSPIFLSNEKAQFINELFCKDFSNFKPYNHFSDEVILRYRLNVPEFDFNKKYIKVVQGKITYIKIQFSDVGKWGDILSEIFGKKIRIYKENINNNTKYIETRNCLRINHTIYEFIAHDKYLKQNMTEDSRNYYLKYWRERIRN